jgi:hypothetical protein
MTDPVSQENEDARAQIVENLRRKKAAYVALFGPAGHPTPLGEIVLSDLDTFCTTFRESIHMDASGRMDPYTTIYRDGKKAVALRIRQMINWSESHADSSGIDSPSG